MGRSRTDRARARPGAALLAVPLALAAVGLSGCGSHHSAATVVTAVRDAVVVAADGTTSPAAVGRHLSNGEALLTKASGAAILSTGGRQAYIGSDSLYYVRSGGADLRRGALIVDGRDGPRAVLGVGTVAVALGKQSVVRVERTAAVRVGVLVGSADVSAESGAHLAITRYHQAVVVGRVLPSRSTALVLTDDSAERRVVPDLVADDEALSATARALDASPNGLAIVAAAMRDGYVVPASSSSSLTVSAAVSPGATLPASSQPPSEVALPVAIARAARGSDKRAVASATRQAEQWRREAGSWGVVARLVGTTSSAVSSAIDALLGPGTLPGPTGPVTQQPGGPFITLPGGPSPSPSPGPSRSPGSPHPSGSPHPTPTPSPTGSPGVVDQVKDVVGKLTPSPLPSALGGLLGDLTTP